MRVFGRSLEMAPFDRSHTSSYSSSIVTKAVSCTVFEIKRDRPIGGKTPICHTPIAIVFSSHYPLEPIRIFYPKFKYKLSESLS